MTHDPATCRTCGGMPKPRPWSPTSRATPLAQVTPREQPAANVAVPASRAAFGRTMPSCIRCDLVCRPDDLVLPQGRYWAHQFCIESKETQ